MDSDPQSELGITPRTPKDTAIKPKSKVKMPSADMPLEEKKSPTKE